MKASDVCMHSGHPEDETPAGVPGAGRCPRRLTLAVVATAVLVVGLVVCLVFFVPRVNQTFRASGEELMEQLQRCQTEQHEVDLTLRAASPDPRCSLCPAGWWWWRGHCYFFSTGLQENRPWNESAEFCQQHNSSLVVIKDSGEMQFIQAVMRTYRRLPFLWVGLTDAQQEGRWVWWDGSDVQHYMPLTVEWDADHRDCADLRGGGSLFAARCDAYGPWTCKRLLTATR